MSRRGGRPPKTAKVSAPEPTSIIGDIQENEEVKRKLPPVPKKRGRPSTKNQSDSGTEDGQQVTSVPGGLSASLMKKITKALAPENDDGKKVQCSECGKSLTMREFRLHNIQCHVNTACTLEEKPGLVMDHKYFARKINEFKKITKVNVFACPKGCGLKQPFKSALGLAYHMNTCGRTEEEMDAVLLTCDLCSARLTLPQMQWHRKQHEEKPMEEVLTFPTTGLGKRRSALVARKSFRKAADKDNDDGNDEDYTEEDTNETSHEDVPRQTSKSKKKPDRGAPLHLDSSDYTVLALEFLEGLDAKKAFDEPTRSVTDPLGELHIPDNPLITLSPDQIVEYLPNHPVSVEFKCKTDLSGDGDYHRLNWFEGESYEIQYRKKSLLQMPASVFHTGGPILSISFHPSGKFLAISVGHSYTDECDSSTACSRPGSLQIYRRSNSLMSLQLVIGLPFGYATHIQWSSFCPDIIESFDPTVASCFADLEIYARLGYIAATAEDPTVRVFSIGIQDIKAAPNFEYKPDHKIAVYTKTPEIELIPIMDDTGNAVRFDWHEGNRYFCVGYSSGYVALFDLHTTSPLLMDKQENVCVFHPFWIMHAHRQAVRGVSFDPKDPRYFVTCGQDRQLKVWDSKTRQERENKRIGICLDLCWVRGWIHQELSFENIVAYQSAMHNYTRIFQTGSGVGKPSSAEIFNVTSLACCNGLTAQGTDDGRLSVTYYDWFWRECDYDRNRKKKNLAVLSTLQLDKDCYDKLSADDFNVEVRKLRKNVLNSKLWQRLAVNDEEGVYSVALESKFGNMNIYEPVPDVDDDDEGPESDEDLEENGHRLENEGPREVQEECQDLMVNEAVSSILANSKDGLIPVFDMKAQEEKEPRIILSLERTRPAVPVPAEGLEPHQVEEYIRFHPYLRVNKVAWSPSGDYIAVGYRNGLVTLLPGLFETIFS